MKSVGAFEAKAHLSSLLDRVAKGDKITITRNGVPAAMLVPVNQSSEKLSHSAVVQAFRELRTGVKPDKMSVREMVNDGRRF
jgi:prevent-host-death family protein